MKTPAIIFALLLALVAAAQTPPAAPAAEAKKDPFDKTRANIDLLLGRRVKPPPFDPSRHNPFTIGPAGGALVVDPKTPDDPPPTASNEALLRMLAPRLRVTGYFAREGLSYATVDGVPRKEGDFIILQHQGAPVNLRVKLVENGRLVLGLGDAEYLVRF
jgi:hypothetical protein